MNSRSGSFQSSFFFRNHRKEKEEESNQNVTHEYQQRRPERLFFLQSTYFYKTERRLNDDYDLKLVFFQQKQKFRSSLGIWVQAWLESESPAHVTTGECRFQSHRPWGKFVHDSLQIKNLFSSSITSQGRGICSGCSCVSHDIVNVDDSLDIMCGITVILRSQENGQLLRKKALTLSSRLRHRGPDWSGKLTEGLFTSLN